MEYNTQQPKLAMPEYGRNIQNMVDHCVIIEDREERKRCAYALIDVMGNMFPHLRDVNDFKHILWDHLAIMSDFKLDIDYPYEVIKKEDMFIAPEHLEYSRPTMEYRHYGKILEKMIKIAAEKEDSEERNHLLKLLVTQMKKSYTQWNKEVEDGKIFQDLYQLSDGKINMNDGTFVIANVKVDNNRDKLKNVRFHRRK
jgi:hypothetical protein